MTTTYTPAGETPPAPPPVKSRLPGWVWVVLTAVVCFTVLAVVFVLHGTSTTTTTAAAAAPKVSTSAPASPSAEPVHTAADKPAPATTAPPQKVVYVPVPAQAAPAPIANAEAVVTQYYADITDGDFAAAWALGGDNLNGGTGYSQWVAGYDTTVSDSLSTFSSWGSDSVQVTITALQSDGSVNTYSGTYTVQGGVIVSASITQL